MYKVESDARTVLAAGRPPAPPIFFSRRAESKKESRTNDGLSRESTKALFWRPYARRHRRGYVLCERIAIRTWRRGRRNPQAASGRFHLVIAMRAPSNPVCCPA